MKKSKASVIFGIIVFIAAMLLMSKDILDLFNSEDVHEVKVNYARETLQVKHKLYYIIPMGTDHYYLAYYEDEHGGISCYVVKADTDWFEENFNDTGYSTGLNDVTINAICKGYSTKYVREISAAAYEFEGLLGDSAPDISIKYPYGLDNVFVLNYKAVAIRKLILLVLAIVLSIVTVIIVKKKANMSPVFLKIYAVVMVLAVLYMLFEIVESL